MKIYNIIEKKEFLEEVATLEYIEWADNPNKNKNERIQKKINKILNNLDKKDFCKLVLIEDNTLIGFISIFPGDAKECPNLSPWYATLYVKSDFRGQGYSKKLNDALLSEARARGFKNIYLKTELYNYYEKFGAKYIKMLNEYEKLYKFDL